MSDPLQVLPFAALVAAVAYAAFKVGVQHERDRPKREEALAFSRGLLFEKVVSDARTELQQHEIRLTEADEVTEHLKTDLHEKLRRLISDDGRQMVFQHYEDARLCMEQVQAATTALRQDRKRYDVLLTPDEIEWSRKHGRPELVAEAASRTGRVRPGAL